MTKEEILSIFSVFEDTSKDELKRYVLLCATLNKSNYTYDDIKSMYINLSNECDGDVSKMLRRCKEDDSLRRGVLEYCILNITSPLLISGDLIK